MPAPHRALPGCLISIFVMKFDLRGISDRFRLCGEFSKASPHGNGLINDTFLIRCVEGGREKRYIIQRINQKVFRDPESLMQNLERVCRYTSRKAQELWPDDASRRSLRLVPTQEGGNHTVDAEGNYWRCYDFIENTYIRELAEKPGEAFEAAKAFGTFQRILFDFPGELLNETIPGFHGTSLRFETLMRAVSQDPFQRVREVKDEIAFAEKREADTSVVTDLMAKGEIPERITHNDTKINNVLFDEVSSAGICVIDLDTVMPGSALFDFGDMVRTSTSPVAEDETDLSKVHLRLEFFEALAMGFLEGARDILTRCEVELLPFSGKLITLENGIRFLTDFLQGDVYFKTHRPGHNIDRCRTQFQLVRSIEEQTEAMKEVLERN